MCQLLLLQCHRLLTAVTLSQCSSGTDAVLRVSPTAAPPADENSTCSEHAPQSVPVCSPMLPAKPVIVAHCIVWVALRSCCTASRWQEPQPARPQLCTSCAFGNHKYDPSAALCHHSKAFEAASKHQITRRLDQDIIHITLSLRLFSLVSPVVIAVCEISVLERSRDGKTALSNVITLTLTLFRDTLQAQCS